MGKAEEKRQLMVRSVYDSATLLPRCKALGIQLTSNNGGRHWQFRGNVSADFWSTTMRLNLLTGGKQVVMRVAGLEQALELILPYVGTGRNAKLRPAKKRKKQKAASQRAELQRAIESPLKRGDRPGIVAENARYEAMRQNRVVQNN